MDSGNLNDSARSILQRELTRRCKNNPRYSLRAFAKALGISHPLLSLILSGKRKLSKKSAKKIAEKLPLQPLERKFFLSELDFAESSSEKIKIDADTFKLILELLKNSDLEELKKIHNYLSNEIEKISTTENVYNLNIQIYSEEKYP